MSRTCKVLKRIKALRKRSDLSQNALAECLGVNRSTYVRKEQGRIPITTEELIKLAELMAVEPGYFFMTDIEAEEVLEDGHAGTLASFYRSLRVMEQQDLLTLIVIAFKGIKRKKVREKIARLEEGRRNDAGRP
ncbi:MAG: helix-turn-helix domain-containing protein [Thermodesulfobacteriota bacterium]